jgi:hypothetical protein
MKMLYCFSFFLVQLRSTLESDPGIIGGGYCQVIVQLVKFSKKQKQSNVQTTEVTSLIDKVKTTNSGEGIISIWQ